VFVAALLELEFPIATPPIATAMAAAPATMILVSLRENMDCSISFGLLTELCPRS
jgi:hypothetical protein